MRMTLEQDLQLTIAFDHADALIMDLAFELAKLVNDNRGDALACLAWHNDYYKEFLTK